MNKDLRDAIAEFIGTFALIFVGCASVVMTDDVLGNNLVGVALAFGLTLGIMVTAVGHISGGHINPAVTAGILVAGKIKVTKAATYWVAQLLGAVVAAFALSAILPEALTEPTNLGTPALLPGIGAGAGAVLEAILTFFLVFVVFATAVDPKGAFNKVAGFAIGLTVTVGILAGGPITGGALNPARWFGPAVVTGSWDNAWVYIVGPVVGGILAAVVYSQVFLPRKIATA
jgi:MIP family channel proteins